MNSDLLNRFSETVASIYAAALQPAAWPDVVQQIAALHNTDKAILLTPTTALQDGGFIVAHGLNGPFGARATSRTMYGPLQAPGSGWYRTAM